MAEFPFPELLSTSTYIVHDTVPVPALIDDFDKTLADLKSATGQAYLPPSPPMSSSTIKVGEAELADNQKAKMRLSPVADTSSEPVSELAPIPPTLTLWATLVFVNVKNMAAEHTPPESFIFRTELPRTPFASQVMTALRQHCPGFQSITAKWSQSRITLGTSQKPISVKDLTYNDEDSGYQELGAYQDVVGNIDIEGFGVAADIALWPILDTDRTREWRNLYNARNASVFAIYVFHQEASTRNAVAIATSASHPTALAPTVPVVVPPTSQSEGTLVRQYLEEHNLGPSVRMYQVIAASDLGKAYKHYSQVRLIRFIAAQIGMTWPDNGGLPKEITTLGHPPLRISIGDLLKLTPSAPATTTFQNHDHEYSVLLKA